MEVLGYDRRVGIFKSFFLLDTCVSILLFRICVCRLSFRQVEINLKSRGVRSGGSWGMAV